MKLRLITMCVLASACLKTEPDVAAPMVDADPVPLLSEVELAQDTQVAGFSDATETPAGGLFATLFQGRAVTPDVDAEASAELAEGMAAIDPAPSESTQPQRRGLRALLNAESEEHEGMARACEVKGRALGQVVDRMPERGRGFRLHDTAPGSTAPRDFYLTGFDDGCARQFTAALALLGQPAMHELVRYDPMRNAVPYSSVDSAYERVKRRVCGARRGEPCGDNKIAALERNTAFITIYETFGSSGNRTEILLHQGEVLAREVASN